MNPLKIAFVSLGEVDVHEWSGIPFRVLRALRRQPGVEVVVIDKLAPHGDTLGSFLMKVRGRLTGDRIDITREPAYLKGIAAEILRRLPADTDIIFSTSSLPLAWLDTPVPKAFYTDACFAGMLDFYFPVATMPERTLRSGNAAERRALETSAIAFFSSDWAARSAAQSYGIPLEKLRVVPFGANLPHDNTRDEVAGWIAQRGTAPVDLLFCGVDWERKRGDFAVDVAQQLNDRGIATRLHVVGIRELPAGLPDFVVDHGYLSKGSEEGAQRMWRIYETSDLLLLPSRAEAFGIVFAEASAYGLPSVATAVGGVPSAVRDGENGKAFPLDAPASEYADWIAGLMSDRNAYSALALRAFDTYEQLLNWDVACRDIVGQLRALVGSGANGSLR